MDEPGPFDRLLRAEPLEPRDRTATVIVIASIVFGLILLILVLPPVSIFGGSDSSPPTGPVTAKERDDLPALPANYDAVSGFYDLISKDPVHGPARLTLTLTTHAKEGETLTLLTYQSGRWVRVGAASPVSGGSAASIEVKDLPANVLVARAASEEAGVVVGVLPPGAAIDQQALDTMKVLAVAGYSLASDGSLVGDPALPGNTNLLFMPVIAAADAGALNTILASADLRAAHVQAIAGLLRDRPFAGVDLDYRAMDPARGVDFVSFVRDLSTALHGESRTLTLTLPVPVRNGAQWDTKGFDWQALAPLVDSFHLAPEVEQDTYYQRMEAALGYLTPIVGGRKLLLTIGPTSHDRGPDGMRSLSLTEALTIASAPKLEPGGPLASGATAQASGANLSNVAGLHWDDTARAVTLTYTGAGGERTIWFADIFSESFKLNLAQRYHLGGVVVDAISQQGSDANIWPAVRQYVQKGNVALATPNGSLLQPHWQASGGTFDADNGSSVAWHAPTAAGDYTLTLIMSDGALRVGQRLQVTVQAAATAQP